MLKCYDMIYLLTAVGLSPGGSIHLHTNNTVHRATQITTEQHKYKLMWKRRVNVTYNERKTEFCST
jgi:hypothetical protein